MKKKAKQSDADILEALPKPVGVCLWPYGGKEPDEILANLEAIRRRWHQNRLGGKSIAFVFEWCDDKYDLSIKLSTFRTWFRENPDGKKEG